jgi:uncharacterized protein (TIGR00299 family) protein
MTIAALLDVGVPMAALHRALEALPLTGYHVHRGTREKHAIVGTSFDVHVEAQQPHRAYRDIDAMIAGSALAEPIKELARRIFLRLGEAEALVHGIPIDEVHFHEVGAVDAIVDVVGAAALLTYLGAEIVCSPLPMGRGFVRAAHGLLPLPAPATVHCLRGCPTYPADIEAELVTPTGAAILATVATRFERWPSFTLERSGFGAGTRDLEDRPNLLRVVLGEASEVATPIGNATHVLVEANVDDITGELAGHAIEVLLGAGALDAWASPVTMKKGRPGLVLTALCDARDSGAISARMLSETTSIGVRVVAASRVERPRRTIAVETPFGSVRCKISEGPYGPAQIKPEFDDCVLLAAKADIPVREVLRAAIAAAPSKP